MDLRPVQSLSACTRVHFTFTFTYSFTWRVQGPWSILCIIIRILLQHWILNLQQFSRMKFRIKWCHVFYMTSDNYPSSNTQNYRICSFQTVDVCSLWPSFYKFLLNDSDIKQILCGILLRSSTVGFLNHVPNKIHSRNLKPKNPTQTL